MSVFIEQLQSHGGTMLVAVKITVGLWLSSGQKSRQGFYLASWETWGDGPTKPT